MSDEEPFAERRPGSALPTMGELQAAVRYATCFGRGSADALERGALFVPLVGLAVGAVLVGVDRALAAAPVPVGAIAVVFCLALLRGDLGWRSRTPSSAEPRPARLAAGDKADAEGDLRPVSRGPSNRRVAAMLWLAAQTAKCVALAASGVPPPALLFAPMLGGWAVVVCAFGARDAAAPATGRKFARGITFREFSLTSVYAFAVVMAVNEALGIAMVLCASAVTVALRVVWHRWFGGVTEARARATGEAVEVAVLLLFAALGESVAAEGMGLG
jgi:cobalamin synthase